MKTLWRHAVPGIVVLAVAFAAVVVSSNLQLPRAGASSVYFYSDGSDPSWGNQANWYLDPTHLVPLEIMPSGGEYLVVAAGSVPMDIDVDSWPGAAGIDGAVVVRSAGTQSFQAGSVHGDADFYGTVRNLSEVYGAVHFHDTSANVSGPIYGDVTFSDWSFNDDGGQITGNVSFEGGSNGGHIDGNATFSGSGYNNGTVNGDAVFGTDSGNAGEVTQAGTFIDGAASDVVGGPGRPAGVVGGSRTRRFETLTSTTLDFIDRGPWVVVAANVAVDRCGATFDENTIFTTEGTGSFVDCPAPEPAAGGSSQPSVTVSGSSGGGSGRVYRYADGSTGTSVEPEATGVASGSPKASPAATGTPTLGVAAPGAPAATFANSRDLFLGSVGEDVRLLQVFLNGHGFPVSALPNPGSAGHETTLFGSLTRAALSRFQLSRGISPAAGYFGPLTRAAVAGVLAGE